MYMITEGSLETNAKEKRHSYFLLYFKRLLYYTCKLVVMPHSVIYKFSCKIIDRILVLPNEPTLWKTAFLIQYWNAVPPAGTSISML